MKDGSWRVGRLGGADLRVRPGLFLMAAALVYLFATRFAGGEHNRYLVAAALVAALYVSVVLHELAHLVAARSHGMGVRSITLHTLGGETAIEGESSSPWQEFITAVVGPLASAAVGAAALGASPLVDGTAGDVLWTLGVLNLLLAAFNLLPAWPMDGGRVLKALVWALTGRESSGTRTAGWVGRLAAAALVVLSGYLALTWRPTAIVDIAVCLLMAWFIWSGSGAAVEHGRRMARVDRLRAVDFVQDEDASELPPMLLTMRGERLLRMLSLQPAEAYALVDRSGKVHGVIYSEDVEAAYRGEEPL